MAAPDQRRRELAAIHVAKKALALEDGTYREMLFTVARVRSAADLDHAGRKAVIEHLRARGFRPRLAPATVTEHGRKPAVQAELQPRVNKIEALLADAGLPWKYAHAIGGRMFNVKQLEWLRAEQLRAVVTALVKRAGRRRAAREAR